MIAELKPYTEYKETELPWLGQVPRHWVIKRGKAYMTAVDQRSRDGKEELLTVSSARGVVHRRTEKVTMFKAESYAGHKLCWPGDLVVNSLWAWAGGLGVTGYHGIISTAYSVYRGRPTAGINPSYIHELVRSAAFHWELRVRSKGVWISRLQLTDTAFLDAPIPLPPAEEQAAIVRFLSWANGRLERAIRSKRKVIALLNEQKQAIFHHAVTRGLDPNISLKPSGIPWIGNVPVHWKVIPLKRIAKFKSGAGFPVQEQGESSQELPFLKVSDMTKLGNERWIESSNNSVSRETASRLGAYVFPANSIIFPKVGGAMLTNKRRILRRPSCIDNNVMGCVITQGDLDFVFFMLQQLDLGRLSKPGPVPAIGEGEVREIKVAIPPEIEQKAVVQFVQAETKGLTATIVRLEREIELLSEYRTRLVADVVTGKLDVREAAVNLPDEITLDTTSSEDVSDDIDNLEEEASE